jgi:hypothetical protein
MHTSICVEKLSGRFRWTLHLGLFDPNQVASWHEIVITHCVTHASLCHLSYRSSTANLQLTQPQSRYRPRSRGSTPVPANRRKYRGITSQPYDPCLNFSSTTIQHQVLLRHLACNLERLVIGIQISITIHAIRECRALLQTVKPWRLPF